MKYKGFSKNLRNNSIVKSLINIRSSFKSDIICRSTLLYLKYIKKYQKIELIKSCGVGAKYYAVAYKNNNKIFIKIANRTNSSKREALGNKYYNNNFIKMMEYKYFLFINYIAFDFIKFTTLDKFKKDKSLKYPNFLENLLFIIKTLYDNKVNHDDISKINIAVIKNNNDYHLELFDLGCARINDKNFDSYFRKDLNNLTKIAKDILSNDEYQYFKNKTKNL